MRRIVVGVICALVVVSGAGCSGGGGGSANHSPIPTEFDQALYCGAFTNSDAAVDADLLNAGDPQAVTAAQGEYAYLRDLAPADLRQAWTVIVDGLPGMIADVTAEGDADSIAHGKFRDAFAQITEDRTLRCLTPETTEP